MGRKPSVHKRPISVKDRVRIHRRRKKMKQLFFSEKVPPNNSSNVSNSTVQISSSSLEENLRDWGNRNRISKRATDDLLSILIAHGLDWLPKNHRTLFKTPTNIILQDIAGGKFWFKGIGKCLEEIFFNLDRDVSFSLDINIDGLPLYNSSTIAFYPILAGIHGENFRVFTVILTLNKND